MSQQAASGTGEAVYQYNLAARRQAGAMLFFAVATLALLITVMALRWSSFGVWTRLLGPLLIVLLLFTVRSQLGRLRYRLQVSRQQLLVDAPLQHRQIAWSQVLEVHRMRLPQMSKTSRWACTVYLPGRRGLPLPLLLFDSTLENAEQALAQIVAYTPLAKHTGLTDPPLQTQ